MNCPNHPETIADQTCARCHKLFCSSCVVTIGDQALCSPCKEERIRELKSGLPAPAEGAGPSYFSISITRLAVMSVATFGIYEVIWFYKQWQWLKRRDNTNVTPLARALFCIFFMRQLFEDVNAHGRSKGVKPLASTGLPVWWLLCQLSSRAPEPWSLFSVLTVLTVLPAQRAMNQINDQVAPDHDRNARFSTGNIIALVLCAFWWILIAVGLAAQK